MRNLIAIFILLYASVSHAINLDLVYDSFGKYISTYGETNIDILINDFVSDDFDVTANEAIPFLETISNNNLRLLRNSVYAKRGFIFKSKDLTSYFNSKNWYKPKSNSIVLSETEEAQVKIIKEIETGSKYLFDDFIQLFESIKLPISIEPYQDKRFDPFGKAIINRPMMRKFYQSDTNILYSHPSAIGKLFSNSNYIVILIGCWDAAGAGSVSYGVASYQHSGELISKQSLSYTGGDIATFRKTEITISKELLIELKITDTDNETLKKMAIKKYRIEPNGIIKEIKKDLTSG